MIPKTVYSIAENKHKEKQYAFTGKTYCRINPIDYLLLSAACAAASLAIGTRNGLQDT